MSQLFCDRNRPVLRQLRNVTPSRHLRWLQRTTREWRTLLPPMRQALRQDYNITSCSSSLGRWLEIRPLDSGNDCRRRSPGMVCRKSNQAIGPGYGNAAAEPTWGVRAGRSHHAGTCTRYLAAHPAGTR